VCRKLSGKKLVIIGCGSAYTPEIFDGIINRNKVLNITNITLVDINEGLNRAKIILAFGERMFRKKGIPCEFSLTTDRRAALKAADFVISQIRVGGIDARIKDETIGLETGIIGQETTGAGGFMNAMRTVPVALMIAKDIEEICPNAWLINFTNPAGIITEAILKHTKVKCVGLCNVPINMQTDAAKVMDLDIHDLHCCFVGLNHLSYIVRVEHNGKNILDTVVERISSNETLMKNIPKVAGVGSLIKTIGIVPSPYLQYYYFENEMLKKQQDEFKQHGKTRGSLVDEIDNVLFDKYSNEQLDEKPEELSQRGGSLYSFVALNAIEALSSDTPTEMVLNVMNNGAVDGLENDDVVEINCMVSKDGVKPVQFGTLPSTARGLIQSIKQYERLTIQAAISCDKTIALKALLNHPLIHGYNNAQQIIAKMEKEFLQYIKFN